MTDVKTLARRILPAGAWSQISRARRALGLRAGVQEPSPVLMRHLRRLRGQGFAPAVVVDVGAARGHWTTSCQRVFPSADYFLVEPNPIYEAELAGLASTGQLHYVKAAAG